MKNHISERIAILIKELGYNFNSFSKVIGLSNNTTIGRIVNEKRNPSYEVLQKIVLRFNDINAYWLLTGEGEMRNTYILEEPRAEYSQDRLDNKLLKYIKEKDAELLRLSEENGKLKKKKKILKDTK